MTHMGLNIATFTHYALSSAMISVVSLTVRISGRRGRPASERERVRDGLVAEGASGGQGEAAGADGAIRRGLGWVGQGLLRRLQVQSLQS